MTVLLPESLIGHNSEPQNLSFKPTLPCTLLCPLKPIGWHNGVGLPFCCFASGWEYLSGTALHIVITASMLICQWTLPDSHLIVRLSGKLNELNLSFFDACQTDHCNALLTFPISTVRNEYVGAKNSVYRALYSDVGSMHLEPLEDSNANPT